MQSSSPIPPGIRSKNKHTIYPASPTLIKQLNLNPKIIDNFITTRNNLVNKKENYKIVHDKRLRPYQNADVEFLTTLRHGKGLFSEQRTGKTPTTLVTMRILNQNRNIIFTTKTNIIAWIQEYRKWHGGPVYTLLNSWNKEKRIYAYKNFKGTLITNYAKAFFDYDELSEYFNLADAIVVDEAHIFRNYTNDVLKTSIRTGKKRLNSAQTTVGLMRLRNNFKDAYALTGTPTTKHKYKIFGILRFLFPTLFTSSYKFTDYYFKVTAEESWLLPTIREIGKFKDKNKENEFLEFLETIATQRKRINVMPWIPKVDVETILLDPTEHQKKWLNELDKYYETTNIMCPNELSVLLAQRQLTIFPKHYKLPDEGAKIIWLKNLLKEYPKRPIIILSFFSTILKELTTYLKIKPENYRLLTGKTTKENSKKYQDDYNNGKFNILFANIDVFNVGLKYNRAEQIVFLDESLIEIYNTQAYDRFLPTTKEEAINKDLQLITKLFIKNSVDTYFHQMLMEGKSETDIINNFTQRLKENRRKNEIN